MTGAPHSLRAWEEYARQVAVAEIGPEGQGRIERSVVELDGEPLIVESARLYLERAGVGRVPPVRGSAPSPCRAVARIGSRTVEVAATGRAEIRIRSIPEGSTRADEAVHVASDATLETAGLLLAVEALKICLGLPPVIGLRFEC